jgi:Tail-tube assembly protein
MPALQFTTNNVDTPTQGAQSQGIGPLAALSPSNDPFSMNQIRYPLEGIGTTDIPHYVVFNINLPSSSKYITNKLVPVSNANVASVQNFDTLSSQGGKYNPVGSGANVGGAVVLGTIATAAQSGIDPAVKTAITGVAAAGLLTTLDLQPKLVRIKQSIAIYMPETVATTYSHSWGSVSATEAGGVIGKYAQIGGSASGALGEIKDVVSTVKDNLFSSEPNKQFNFAQEGELGAQLLTSTGTLGPGFTDLTLKSLGKAVNPHVEMLFKQTENRQFEFVFHFIPRSQQESVAIYNIIKTFKAYAAPEVSAEAGGRYFIPPGQFDISFYFMQAVNPTIAKISTCALTQIQVNYSGAGSWTTFNDGNPLKIDLSLTFTEMDIITRELITQYGY